MATIARRIVRPALYVNAAISLAVGLLVFLLQLTALPRAEPVLSTRVGDLTIAYAVVCVIVASMLRNDRRWLLVPITFCAAEVINCLVQAVIKATGAAVRTDPQLAQPLVTYLVFLLIYVAAFVALGRPAVTPAAGGPASPEQAHTVS